MRVTLAVPCFDTVYTDFAFSLASMLARMPKDIIVDLMDIRGTDIVGARNSATKFALERESHLFFLDSDIEFPVDTLHRLVAHGKPVVGASYIRRCKPYDLLGLYDEPFSTKKPLISAKELPTGCLFVNNAALKRLSYPYFKFEYNEKTQVREFGEDQYFSKKLREVGINLYLDTKLSTELSHVGVKKYKIEG